MYQKLFFVTSYFFVTFFLRGVRYLVPPAFLPIFHRRKNAQHRTKLHATAFTICFLLFAFCFLLFAFCFLLFAFCFLLFAFCFLQRIIIDCCFIFPPWHLQSCNITIYNNVTVHYQLLSSS